MAKNIALFADGTGQGFTGGRHPSNVFKLFNLIDDRSPSQIAFYDSGVGVGHLDLLGKITGAGMSAKIRRAYEFILEHYRAGDQLYLFGFSRGAATMSLLSEFLHLFGVLPMGHRELIPKAYRIFDIGDGAKRKRESDEFVSRHHTMWVNVEFLGVWDTVTARGIPIQYLDELPRLLGLTDPGFKGHDLDLSQSVKYCCHALAIDEERKVFIPRIFTINPAYHQTLKQVWFSGSHTDIGGGYENVELSDISLQWIMSNAEECGLHIYTPPSGKVEFRSDPNGILHDPRSGFRSLYRQKTRSWGTALRGKPLIHASVLERTLNSSNKASPRYAPWILDADDDYEVEPWSKLPESGLSKLSFEH